MKVAVCDYGAGNVRSVVLALERLGARRGHGRSGRRRDRRPRRAARRRLGRQRDGGACASAALDEALRERSPTGGRRSASASGCSSRSRRARRTAASRASGSCPGRAVRLASGARAADRLGAGRAGRRARTTSRTRTPPRRRPRRRGPRASSPRREPARSSACSSTPRRAAPRARAGSGAMPLPRLIPCLDVAGGRVVKGVRFEGLRDVGDPVELGAALLGRGRRRARLPRRQGDARGARHARRARRAASPSALAIPFTVGGGVRSVADADALLAAGADKVSRQLGGARAAGAAHRARRAARLAGGRRRDRRDGRPRSLARRNDASRPRRGRVGARGASARRGRDPAHLDRRRRHPRRLRPRADRARSPTRSRCR